MARSAGQDGASGRRHFLRLAAGVAAGTAGLAAGRADAFQIMPAEDYAKIVENACGAGNAVHARLLADAEKSLGVKPGDPGADALLSQVRCPYCGCPVLPDVRSGGASQ